MRSLATSNRRSSSSENSSRTFPLPTWTAVASGMNRLLLSHERVQPLEDGVDMTDGGIQIEHGGEIDVPRDLGIGTDERPEVSLFLPGLHGVSLDEPVCLVPRNAGLDEREQQAVAENESVTRIEVPPHPVRIDDEPLDDPRKAVEHVVEREEGIRDDHPLGRRVRDVALVPERHVLEAGHCGCADDPP